MQYVRNLGGSVSRTWNSINPATLSGAIDVIVVEQEDGSLGCSPFHVRFGKFSLLRPSEKKVEFRVNGAKQDYSMKLGDGGEAFFVFETTEDIPEALQTSPLVSPASSPEPSSTENFTLSGLGLGEPTYLDISGEQKGDFTPTGSPPKNSLPIIRANDSSVLDVSSYGSLPSDPTTAPEPWSGMIRPTDLERSTSEDVLASASKHSLTLNGTTSNLRPGSPEVEPSGMRASVTPPALRPQAAYNRAMTLSKKLSTSNIRSKVTETGDLMLDMTGYKSSEDDALRAEVIARNILSEELEGNYDIGALIGTDENGNLWIYSSEEAKDAATRKAALQSGAPPPTPLNDAASDPGYHSGSDGSPSPPLKAQLHQRAKSEQIPSTMITPTETIRNFAKTLRLTSEQLKQLKLKPGANPVSFTVNKATCTASMYYWTYDVPVVISDIDGTITKSDALGHLLNMVGRDWTHTGVAKLYSDIAANGFNIFYLTSRSVGQADTTRAYLSGIVQEGWKLPKGPVIMSPDRTIAALRREVYLRKPEVFKMACLRDILSLYPGKTNPFYAGFGNRLTDALSYRTVHIPSSRIFTINTNAEVSLDLIGLNKYRSSYVSMREIVDHFFPPVSTLVKEGGEDFTDFTYWRDTPAGLDEFTPSDSGEEEMLDDDDEESDNDLGESFLSRESVDQPSLEESLRESLEIRQSEEPGSYEDEEHDLAMDYLGDSFSSAPTQPPVTLQRR